MPRLAWSLRKTSHNSRPKSRRRHGRTRNRNVASWLKAEVTDPAAERLLCPHEQTFLGGVAERLSLTDTVDKVATGESRRRGV